MHSGTIVFYSDDPRRPEAEVVLANRDRVRLILDQDGLSIFRIAGPLTTADVIFHADEHLVSHICAALLRPEAAPTPSPLRILVAAIVQVGSAEDVAHAFADVAAILNRKPL